MSPQETAVRLGAMEAFGITGETKVFDDAKLLKKLAKAEGIEKPNFDIWNPLRDNGIAHTIAVRRGIEIRYDHDAEQVECYYDSQCDQWLSVSWKDRPRIVAVNRAICLAAIAQQANIIKDERRELYNLPDLPTPTPTMTAPFYGRNEMIEYAKKAIESAKVSVTVQTEPSVPGVRKLIGQTSAEVIKTEFGPDNELHVIIQDREFFKHPDPEFAQYTKVIAQLLANCQWKPAEATVGGYRSQIEILKDTFNNMQDALKRTF